MFDVNVTENYKSRFDVRNCFILVTGYCGKPITRVESLTQHEKSIIVQFIRNLVLNQKCGKEFRHGEIVEKHILIDEEKKLKLIDFDPTSMYVPNDLIISPKLEIELGNILEILSKITVRDRGNTKLPIDESSSRYSVSWSLSEDFKYDKWYSIKDVQEYVMEAISPFVKQTDQPITLTFNVKTELSCD